MDLTSFLRTAKLEDRGPAGIVTQKFRPPLSRIRKPDCTSGNAQLLLALKARPHRDAHINMK